MTKVCKWGNSLGLRIPSAIAGVARIKRGTPVNLRLLDNGSLLVTPLSGTAAIQVNPGADVPNQPDSKW